MANEDVSQDGNKIEMSRPKLNIKPQGKKIRYQPGPSASQNQHSQPGMQAGLPGS